VEPEPFKKNLLFVIYGTRIMSERSSPPHL
jgi:hypothetical protein